jgi:hypothetical protein
MSMQMMPPGGGSIVKMPRGVVYTGVDGAPQVVPDFDAAILEANGWVPCSAQGGAQAGTTANRPINPKKGTHFVDTTVGTAIVHDGKVWRHSTTGAAV